MLWFESLLFNVFISNITKYIGLENMCAPEVGGGGGIPVILFVDIIAMTYLQVTANKKMRLSITRIL